MTLAQASPSRVENIGRIHRISLPTPFPVGDVNVYLIDGEPLTLLDTGVNTEKSVTILEDCLKSVGKSIESIKRVIVSHGHADHFGAAELIRQRSGAAVMAHKGEAPKIVEETSFGFQYARVYLTNGFPEKLLISYASFGKYLGSICTRLGEVQWVQDGESLEFENGGPLEIVHCPGHTPGLLCLFDRKEKILLSTDHILGKISPNPMIEFDPDNPDERFPSLPSYLHSIDKIFPLNPEIALPGHGSEVKRVGEVINNTVRHHENRMNLILDIISRRGPATVFEVTKEVFGDTLNDSLLGFSEVLGHIDLLRERHLVEEETDDSAIIRLRASRN